MKYLILLFFIAACGVPKAARETVYESKSPMIVLNKTKVGSMRGKYKYLVKDAGFNFDLLTNKEYEIGDTLFFCTKQKQ